MTPEQVIALARQTLEAAFWVAAPILISATVVSLVINIGQVMTSMQDPTVTTVPRLAAVGGIMFLADAVDAASSRGIYDQHFF